jgi:hypothetical protein
MARLDVQHGGGDPLPAIVVNNSGRIQVLPDHGPQSTQGKSKAKLRGYAIFRADKANSLTLPIFIHQGILANGQTFSVGDGGIPLWPGDVYEILEGNLYLGPVWAACADPSAILHRAVGF